MFERLKYRFAAMRTIRALCEKAEAVAAAGGEQEPGAEHFLLAAMDLPDGTARAIFAQFGTSPEQLEQAIARQYADALKSVGMAPEAAEAFRHVPVAVDTNGLYRASPSGLNLIQELAADPDKARLPVGAHVVAVVAGMDHGVAARALRTLGIDKDELRRAARLHAPAA